jgi:ribosomal protein S8
MLEEAQKQNTTLENLALTSLQKAYGIDQSIYPNLTPAIVDFFIALRDGMNTGQPTVQTPADNINLQIAESLKRSGVLLDFQVNDQQLTLHINPNPPVSPPLSDMDLAELDPEFAKIVEDLKHGDENTRYQAIQKIAQLYGQQS